MKSFMKLVLVLALVASSTVAMARREVGDKDFSGWLKDYDSLQYNEERNAYIFFNEDKRGNYKKVLLDSVTVYSKSDDSDSAIATKATEYLGSGVAALLKEDLKFYNFVPVSAVFRGAQAATGKVATYIDTMFEAEMTDSVSGGHRGNREAQRRHAGL
jgi:hypothetical protein